MEMTAVVMRWHFVQLSVLEMNHNRLHFLRPTCENICCSALNGTLSGEKVTKKKRVKETVMLEIISTCRSIENGNMVECEVCKEWFHQGCLTVPQSVWNKPSAPWMCHSCDKNSRNKRSCMYSKVIVIGFQISSCVCVACIH